MTIQKKTALIFTCITAAILLLVSCIAYFFMNVFAFQDYYKRLEIRGIITAKAQLEQYPNLSDVYTDIRQQHLEPLPGEKEIFFPTDSLQAFINSRNSLHLPLSFYKQIILGKPANYKVGNFFYTGLLYQYQERSYVVITGAQNEDSIRYARNLKWILVACCLCGIIAAYTSGIFFSRHTFKPFRDIIDKVKTIGAENLHLRVEDRQGEDEIAELAHTFNQMLSRLETAFETQNNFISNASHELRTPLTTIYGECEIALSRERSDAEYKNSLNIVLMQAEKLQQLTDSLLNLAQAGFDGKKQNMKPLRIDELLIEVKNTINKIIPDNNIQIDLGELPANEHGITVTGNYNLLKLGLSNILENACKYSANDLVQVEVINSAGKLYISVQDRGIGIPQQELKYIYDPFFRASNTAKFQGYGIGLPLTRNIFRLHNGEINVQSTVNEGTKVTLILPLAFTA